MREAERREEAATALRKKYFRRTRETLKSRLSKNRY